MNTKINMVIAALEEAKAIHLRHHPDEASDPSAYMDMLDRALSLLRSLPSEQGEGPYIVKQIFPPNRGGFSRFTINGPGIHGDYGMYVTKSQALSEADVFNTVWQAGRLSAQLAHPPQVGPKDQGDASKTRPALSAVSPQPSASEDAAPIAIANAKLPWCLWDPNGGGVSVVGPFPDGTYGDPGKPYGSYTKRVQFRVVNGEIHVQP